MQVTDDMVNRFLAWKLPQDIQTDGGISFVAPTTPGSWPSGTNLLTATQARQMLEHVLAQAQQPTTPLEHVLAELADERTRQDAKWGGSQHDDSHTVPEWVRLLTNYAGWAEVMAGMGSYGKARKRLLQVAALAIAAVQSLDRNTARGYFWRNGAKVYMSYADKVMD